MNLAASLIAISLLLLAGLGVAALWLGGPFREGRARRGNDDDPNAG